MFGLIIRLYVSLIYHSMLKFEKEIPRPDEDGPMRNTIVVMFLLLVSIMPAHAQQKETRISSNEISSLRKRMNNVEKQLKQVRQDVETKIKEDIDKKISKEVGIIKELSDKTIAISRQFTEVNQLSMKSLSDMIWVLTLVVTGLAGVLTFLGFREYKNIKDLREGIESWEGDIKSSNYLLEARSWVATWREYSTAIEKVDLALLHNPNNDRAWAFKAYCEKRMENISGAERSTERAISLNRNEGFYHYNLACYASLLQKFEKAAASIKEAIRLDPDQVTKAHKDADFNPMREDEGIKTNLDVINIIGRSIADEEQEIEEAVKDLRKRLDILEESL